MKTRESDNIPTYIKLIGFTVIGCTTGIYINNCDIEISDCIIRNNTDRGINSSNPGNSLTITNTIVRDNNETGLSANGDGAGIFVNGGTSHVIRGCYISNNKSSGRGGGVFAQNITTGNITLISTEVSNNYSISAEGGVCSNSSNIVIKKCRIISSLADGGSVAGGLFAQGTGHNCFAHANDSEFTLKYCNLVYNGNMLSGNSTFNVNATNIGSDPLFNDAENDDYSLKSVSPCIDFDTSTGAPRDDINGQMCGVVGREDGNITGDYSDFDIGANEYVP